MGYRVILVEYGFLRFDHASYDRGLIKVSTESTLDTLISIGQPCCDVADERCWKKAEQLTLPMTKTLIGRRDVDDVVWNWDSAIELMPWYDILCSSQRSPTALCRLVSSGKNLFTLELKN